MSAAIAEAINFITNPMLQQFFGLGAAMEAWTGESERRREEWSHTCENKNLRYPWPWMEDCEGCRLALEKYVRRRHLEVPYRLFGFQVILEHYIRELAMHRERQDIRNHIGAYI